MLCEWLDILSERGDDWLAISVKWLENVQFLTVISGSDAVVLVSMLLCKSVCSNVSRI